MMGLRTLAHPSGVELDICDLGAQAMGWRVDGAEQLYTSPLVDYANGKPLRGGVPICFPQFNQRVIDGRKLPKHGFSRTVNWRWQGDGSDAHGLWAKLALTEADLSPQLRGQWPFAFAASCSVSASRTSLRVEIAITNSGETELPFALALHTYLRVDGTEALRIDGLQGASYWDAVADLHEPSKRHADQEALGFGQETDRVYADAPREVLVQDGPRCLRISASESLPDTVVWNPGPELCAQLADMPTDGWRHMLCVEAAAIERPARLAAGQTWGGWQELSLN